SSKRIVLELEEGSTLPDDQFLEEMAKSVQDAVANLEVKTNVVTEEGISLEEAKQIAFDHAGVKAEDAVFDDEELDTDDGNKIFELEFYANGYEYEYDIHAETGEILKSERDREEDKKVTQKAEPTQKSQPAQTNKKSKKQAAKKADYLSLEQAKEIAFKHAGVDSSNARFDDQEFDIDDGVPSYELEFYVNGNEYEYDIHAVSGSILKFEHDIKEAKQTKPAKKAKPASNKPTQISKDEAINIALNHAGLKRNQVSFDDIELDDDDGRLIWEIEFESGDWEFEYDIDAYTKNILDFEKDLDD
ncbi:MAG TPA: PepSY domain-containing protein, partial [Atopostipes sp.]|nr:PepSY domain-containing protein [Atopostipes sp.]